MEETDVKPGTLKLFQRGIGKLFMVAAGMGVVVLVVFVVGPMLLEPAPEPPPMAPEEIVAEVMSEPEAEEEVVDGAPAPLVPEADLPVEAEPLAAIYPAEEETIFEAGLPPVLSPEEIEAALSDPAPADSLPAESALAPEVTAAEQAPVVAQASAEARPVGGAVQLPDPPSQAPWQPELTVAQDMEGGRLVEMTLPPPEATREVQELLESLGYEPGPVDGVWGDRTARAWKNFARDSADLEASVELARARPMVRREIADASPHPEASAPPSGGTGVEAAPGTGQAGPPHTGLPLEREGRRVPGTLRGVMGYRLPLISRQEVPDQIVSGVLIPAHTTFVILREGEWELVGLSDEEARRLRAIAAEKKARQAPEASAPESQPARRWDPLRLFRRQAPHRGRE